MKRLMSPILLSVGLLILAACGGEDETQRAPTPTVTVAAVPTATPGPTDTPILRAFTGEGEQGQKVYDALKRAIPMKRLGEPEDIAGMTAFLASDEAGFITGQVISVSGGLTMHG